MSTLNLTEGVNRRDFLLLGSGAMVAVAALGSDLLPRPVTARSALSIGFVEPDLAQRTGVQSRFSPNVVPATRIGSSDGTFISNGARVTAFGPARDNTKVRRGSHAQFELITYFTATDGAQVTKVPFHTWMASPDGRSSVPVSFTVPVDGEQRLSMGVLVKQQPAKLSGRLPNRRELLPSTDEPDENNVTLTLLSDPSAPKLRRGYYILAIGDDKFAPNWGSMELRRTENGFQLLEISAFETKPVDFDFVVLSIDYDRNGEQAKKNAAKR